jgi:hypothetical protein
VESISKIQQLLAESKFVEAQKMAEILLYQSKGSETQELLEFYFESLQAQSRPLPSELIFLLVDKLLPMHTDEAQKWLGNISKDKFINSQRTIIIEIKIAEIKGKTEELYNLISQYQILRFESHTPNIPSEVLDLIKKYFPNDFHLQLQKLAIELMRMDLVNSEISIKKLILSCFEKSSPKGTKLKINLIHEILTSSSGLQFLELYKNFCFFMASERLDKKDYKKLIELVIYMEDFKFQVLILNLLVRENLKDEAVVYAQEIRKNREYNYVYLDKYFPQLKQCFFQRPELTRITALPLIKEEDLKVGKIVLSPLFDEILSEVSEEEILLAHLLKYQNFSTSDLLEIAVSFVQSEFYMAALKASDLAYDSTDNNNLRLQACYLKVTCLLKTADYRAALDISLNALNYSVTQNDILSFLYSQAEAHLKLQEYISAKRVLERIIDIDASYRQVKERLEWLNAI